LPHSSLSTTTLSKSTLSNAKIGDALGEIEDCVRLIDSAKSLPSSSSCEHISVTNKNLAYVAYGILISEFSKILLVSSLNSLREVMSMDHQYLSGNKVDQIETSTSDINSSVDLEFIASQISEIERWLGE